MTRAKTAPSPVTAVIVGVVSIALGVAIALLAGQLGVVAAGAWFGAICLLVLGLFGASQLRGRVGALVGQLRVEHLLWAALFLSGLTFRVRDVQAIETTLIDSAALLRIGIVGVVALIAVVVALRERANVFSVLVRGAFAVLSVYCLFGVFSAFWSIQPAWSAYKALEYFVDVFVAALIVSTCSSWGRFAVFWNWSLMILATELAAVWIGVAIHPSSALKGGVGSVGIQLQGIMPVVSANGVGELGAVIALIAVARLLRPRGNRTMYWVAFVWGAGTMLLAQSRSPIAAFVVGLAVVLVAEGRVGWLWGVFVGALGVLYSPLAGVVSDYLQRGQTLAAIGTLSNRTSVYWEPALVLLREHPWLGVGAYAGGRFAVVSQISATTVGTQQLASSVDNAYIEAAISTGAVGLGLMIAAVAAAGASVTRGVRRLQTSVGRAFCTEALGLLAIQVMRGFFSSGPIIWHPATAFLMVVAAGAMASRTLAGIVPDEVAA